MSDKKWTNATVKIDDILNTIQVRPETTTKEMDALVRSLKKEGTLLQPIGLCNSEELKEYPEKKYHLIWGQRRIYVTLHLTSKRARAEIKQNCIQRGRSPG